MKKRKIIIFDRFDAEVAKGGDTVQIRAIKEFLQQNGHEVDLFYEPVDVKKYDMVFIFNLQRPFEGLIYASIAMKYDKPFLFFPIYWDLDALQMEDVFSIKSVSKNILPSKLQFIIKVMRFYLEHKSKINKWNIKIYKFFSFRRIALFIMNNAKHIIVNSRSEKVHLIDTFSHGLESKTHIIYNGTNIKKNEDGSQFKYLEEKYDLPDSYICCIGGIGPRKNQLNLIRAANTADSIPLIIIGEATHNNKKYYQKIKKISNKNVKFINQLTHEEIAYILKRSQGHIQPSYIETPGLASLEAFQLNCPICVSDIGPVREYFDDKAIFVNPYSVDSIKLGLEKLFNCERDDRLSSCDFRWEHVLKGLLDLI